jgi:Ca2+-binding protein (EF-Hand superfamily)
MWWRHHTHQQFAFSNALQSISEKLELCFEVFDQDMDGTLSFNELTKVCVHAARALVGWWADDGRYSASLALGTIASLRQGLSRRSF